MALKLDLQFCHPNHGALVPVAAGGIASFRKKLKAKMPYKLSFPRSSSDRTGSLNCKEIGTMCHFELGTVPPAEGLHQQAELEYTPRPPSSRD